MQCSQAVYSGKSDQIDGHGSLGFGVKLAKSGKWRGFPKCLLDSISAMLSLGVSLFANGLWIRMLSSSVQTGGLRLLETLARLLLRAHTHCWLIVLSAEVIHSFALPNLAVKIDAIPGR